MKKNDVLDIIKDIDAGSDLFNEIVNVLSFGKIESSLNVIYNDSEIHKNVQEDINSYVKLHRSTAKEKIDVIDEMSKRRLKKSDLPSQGKVVDVYSWLNGIYKTSSTTFFKDFVNWLLLYTKNPQGQGSTGVGRGEHMLIFLGKGGKFADKGDVIFDGMFHEVKNNGEIYLAPNPYKNWPSKLNDLLGVKGHGIKNLQTFVGYTNTNKKSLGYDTIYNAYVSVYEEMFSNIATIKKEIPNIFKSVIAKDGSTEQAKILDEFKTLMYNQYKKEYKFDSILFFEISKGKNNMSFTTDPKYVTKANKFSVSGLNFTNGNRGSGLRIAI